MGDNLKVFMPLTDDFHPLVYFGPLNPPQPKKKNTVPISNKRSWCRCHIKKLLDLNLLGK